MNESTDQERHLMMSQLCGMNVQGAREHLNQPGSDSNTILYQERKKRKKEEAD